ncbi:invasion associated locus B family protein [Phaeobacter gallaeciensis]|uniref:Invasion protein B, involved in pathogenesis n=1 Tax=Phaeobacter gallaeciensis TaxID=60890 RepID=A0AAD0ED10_9RHOB|nr:invasion associated locus B family protein [Phaeobacter gallaeciensis]AHD09561.1 Invasion protein B, involved in pathogenesis [Phaeobacter gallaeciensis DSM 26640]ATE92826.1 Invasion protein B, involved in pathogenesis [Phaeobacter gallaeciensis]ATE97352.1 Invasion protein B, involved in pathogenesis [Phaeobacter gallaeciensis]ATF01491.1 Invasion protein B, involved in pathogenesis [Phaeobacter gallaeciensis]ATF05871.1 Invasion protein B, involved in pathogenesis [Phaeobacter gallaeciensis]
MIKSLTPMTLAALMALPLPLMAQDTAGAAETEESQPAAEATTEAPKADDVLDLGQPVQDGPQLGQRYSKETHGDWDLACVKTEGESDPCSLLQIMTDTSGNPMAEFSMFRIKQEGSQAVAGATVIVPLETLLPAALTISIDGAPGKRYNYSFCNPMGCVAQIGLTETDISAFKKGKKATLSLRPAPAPDQVINMELSLSGFTAGYNVVDVVEQ